MLLAASVLIYYIFEVLNYLQNKKDKKFLNNEKTKVVNFHGKISRICTKQKRQIYIFLKVRKL